MTNSKHIKDLYPEARTSEAEAPPWGWGSVLLILAVCAFWGGVFWFGYWLTEKYPIFFFSVFVVSILVIVAAVFVKLALAVLAVLFWER